jgi:hypothetical protein
MHSTHPHDAVHVATFTSEAVHDGHDGDGEGLGQRPPGVQQHVHEHDAGIHSTAGHEPRQQRRQR